MYCYFDIFIAGEVILDLEGIEVADLDDAIVQAQSAVEEIKEEEDLIARLGTGALIIVRIRFESIYCMIALDT